MKQTLSTSQIADALYANKENAGWSWAGARALAEYLEATEISTGEDMELDVVAIRCDFSEYESLEVWAEDYFGGKEKMMEILGLDTEDDEDDIQEAIRDCIQNQGTLIEFKGGIIVPNF